MEVCSSQNGRGACKRMLNLILSPLHIYVITAEVPLGHVWSHCWFGWTSSPSSSVEAAPVLCPSGRANACHLPLGFSLSLPTSRSFQMAGLLSQMPCQSILIQSDDIAIFTIKSSTTALTQTRIRLRPSVCGSSFNREPRFSPSVLLIPDPLVQQLAPSTISAYQTA